MKQVVIGTGLSGLVGSRITELLKSIYQFEDLSLESGVDITDIDVVNEKIRNSKAKWVWHLAAKTDVDKCELDRVLGVNGAAWRINVEATRNLVTAANNFGKRLLYVSTDFVFAGDQEEYTENDMPNPINWYGQTKYEGEKIVSTQPQNLIVRITYPYRARCPMKSDFVNSILIKLKQNEQVNSISDQIFTPTFIDDIAEAFRILVQNDSKGIYHAVGSESLTPYQAAIKIAQTFGFNPILIQKITLKQFYSNRAVRPFKLRTRNDKIKNLNIRMRTFSEGIQEVKHQKLSL